MSTPDRHTILLIDDEPMMHDLARLHLEKSGYRLISSYNGNEGLETILQQRPDLVLLDFMMPDMDGEKVFHELTHSLRYRLVSDTPVIMLTARGSNDPLKATMLERGVSAYLQKPFGLRELTNVIDNVFIIHEIRRRNLHLQSEVESTRDYLTLIMRTAPIGIFASDANGQIRQVNQVLCNLLGFEQLDSIVGRNVFDEASLRDTFLRTAVARVLTGQVPWKIRNFHFMKPSERRRVLNIHCIPLRRSSGELEGVVGIVEDITETQKRDEQLQMLSTIGLALQSVIDLDDLLHLILTAITAGPALGFTRAMIFLADRSGQNLVGKMAVGPPTAEEADRIWQTLGSEHISLEDFLEKYGKHRPAVLNELSKIVRQQSLPLTQKECGFVAQIMRKRTYRGVPELLDHSECQKVFSLLELTDFVAVPLVAKDRIKGVIIADTLFSTQSVDEDLISLLELFASQAAQAIEKADAYRRLEWEKRKLERAYRQLQVTHKRLIHAERLATIGNMAAHVAHEIRNPLVTIGGFARSLNKQLHDQNAVKTVTGIITDEVMRLEKILANVLNFSKLPEPSLQPADINHIVEEVRTLLADEAGKNKVRIEVKFDPGIPMMMVDTVQMNQLLVNLFRNGIQAMPTGGELFVATALLPDHRVEISVKDTGCGIPSEVIENVFDPFFTTKSYGTGLGLAICRQIAHDHGGEIFVQSTVGAGTVFTVQLPIIERERPAPVESEAIEEESFAMSPYLA